ncbi:MAG: NADH-quinone oxidoreductase subunit L [Verrucomicrobia bacterium]|nr:NADH-quinone oxidoreductase subunit L [Verrucomicrobiota bacterium]
MLLADLIRIKEQELAGRKPFTLRVCMAAGCVSSNAEAVLAALDRAVKDAGLESQIEVRPVGCLRLCCEGPLVAADPDGKLYKKVRPEDAVSVVKALQGGPTSVRTGDMREPFFEKQFNIVLANSGLIDPERIESYIAADGYVALRNVLRDMSPADVISAITKSGLRGRGGAGYPTGLKWSTVAKTKSARKYVVCNGDEGDPGAFMDRSVLESDPHRVIEGMIIAGYAVGAQQGFIYVRAEYPLAIKRLQTALKQARQFGLLGSNVLESPFSFNIDIRIGAGAFVCGEETALMASIEGLRGNPRPRPPFPAESGLFGEPTLINNVETFANVAPIILQGPEWYASIGTEKSKGTKVFALAGKITRTGLIEVPMGIKLREIVEEIGGGAPEGAKIKAVQTGGPSGGCIPASELDTPVDYESLTKLGSIMGSGGMIVMDETTNMVDVARFFMDFCVDESCGKCIPCRAGTVQMHRLLTKILNRQATESDLKTLEDLCELVRSTSLCGLGQTAPNPVLSTLRFFRSEYIELLQPKSPSPECASTAEKKGEPADDKPVEGR